MNRKKKKLTPLEKLNKQIKELEGTLKRQKASGLGGIVKKRIEQNKEKIKKLKKEKSQLGRDFQGGDAGKPRGMPRVSSANLGPQPRPKTVKEIPEPKALKSTAKPGPAELASEKPKTKTKDTTIDKSAGSKEEGIGTKIARALGDRRSEEEMIRTRKMNEEDEEEMNFRKGGAVKKKYGMREGGFTKRGGMYKKGY